MRPDKKKTRHHDSQKSKKKALEKAEKASGNKEASKAPKRPLPPPQPKIVNNWTNLEIPSEDEEEFKNDDWGETGPKFEYVLQNADKSDSYFRTKIEKEWEEQHAHFTSDFFSLDINRLNSAIASVPLHDILDIQASEISDKFIQQFTKGAEERHQIYNTTHVKKKNTESSKDIQNQEKSMAEKLASLSVENKPVPQPEKSNIKSDVTENKETQELEEWLDDFLAD